jgi:hypothetical protein
MRDPEIMAAAIDGQHSSTSGAYRAKIIVFMSVQWLFGFNKEDDMDGLRNSDTRRRAHAGMWERAHHVLGLFGTGQMDARK